MYPRVLDVDACSQVHDRASALDKEMSLIS